MRKLKEVRGGRPEPCLKNDGSKVCPCQNWHGEIATKHGKIVGPFVCHHGQSHEVKKVKKVLDK